ncbi:MAG: DinB family protein [Acidobacteria bacterium]|nr:DinB family protein [Acidobacteriota bacterium]
MRYELDRALEILERTPKVLDALLRGLDRAWTEANEGPGTWSPAEVVTHLVVSEEVNWIARTRWILEQGDRRPFEPLDPAATLDRYAGWPLDRLLDRFAQLRLASLKTVRGLGLTDEQLGLRGAHPEFGNVFLRQLLATWVVHDQGHLVQIERTLARQYDEAVGPWRAYLSVLKR